jgi:hypothetical protein
MHLTEGDLILHYYGERPDAGDAEAHLAACAACRGEFERLRQVLHMMDAAAVPEPPEGFERVVWARLQPALEPRGTWLSRLLQDGVRPWVWGGGVAALVAAAFVAGRFSTAPPSPRAAVTAPQQADTTAAVLLIAVDDHLDRSQMVLIELLNAEDGNTAAMSGEQARAKELVAANRLYRQTAVQAGNHAVGDVLDDLERVLLEIANQPADASAADLDALRARIQSRGLLFRVRVVQSEIRERERRTLNVGSTS